MKRHFLAVLFLLLGTVSAFAQTYVGPIDASGVAAAHCYALRACSAAYATAGGNAITIQRASDNTTLNVAVLSNGNLNTAAAVTFCASTTCTITTWFDQVGTANETQSTVADQAALTFNCINSTLPCAVYTGGQQYSAAIATIAAPWTLATVAIRTSGTGFQSNIDASSGGNLAFNDAANSALFSFGPSSFSAAATDNVWHSMQASGAAGNLILEIDGVGTTNTGTPSSNSGSLMLGAASGSAFLLNGKQTQNIVWATNLSPAQLTALNANDCAFWATGTGCTGSSIAPNNAAIFYSPYGWNVTSTAAQTIDAGAYFKTLFSGSSLTLNFNVTNNSTPLSEIYYRVDGYEAQTPWIEATVASTITVTLPTNTSQYPFHLIEVTVKSTSQTINRWNSPSNTVVVFSGLTLGAGQTVSAPVVLSHNMLVLGDSITEGVRTVNQTATNDTDQNDAMQGWAFGLGGRLGAEIGVVGFGNLGLTVQGSGNVPVLPSSYNLLFAGQARTFSPQPDLIVINIGTNDGSASGASVTSALIAVLNGLITANPGTPIAVMEPFANIQTAALQAGVAGCSNPSVVTFVNTTGFVNPTFGIDSTGFHPTGANDLGKVAAQVANAVRPLLNPRRFNISVTN
jgi:lysophospholipase L1-like esterase